MSSCSLKQLINKESSQKRKVVGSGLVLDSLHLALHVVESGTILEPVDLEVVEGVVQGEGVGATVVVGDSAGNLNKSLDQAGE